MTRLPDLCASCGHPREDHGNIFCYRQYDDGTECRCGGWKKTT